MHKGHFQVPYGMAVRGGRRQSICHPGMHVTKKHFLFVKWTLTDLAVNIIWWG